MHIPRVMCYQHGEEMVIRQTGILVECTLGNGEPYYKIYADLFGCRGWPCAVLLPADVAVSQHFMDSYASFNANATVKLT